MPEGKKNVSCENERNPNLVIFYGEASVGVFRVSVWDSTKQSSVSDRLKMQQRLWADVLIPTTTTKTSFRLAAFHSQKILLEYSCAMRAFKKNGGY